MLSNALPISAGPATARVSAAMTFPGAIGFFFVSRACLTYLFFQGDPVLGTIVSIAINLGLLFGTIVYTADDDRSRKSSFPFTHPLRWMLALFAFSVASLCWTGAQSLVAALAYWLGMTTDVVIVLLLLRHQNCVDCSEAIMKGAVWGAVGLAAVAWCSPVTADLRLGNDEFLHPNTLGLEFGITALIAQYLVSRGVLWKWLGVALAITLLRTLSKTAIIAFVVAECWYLMQSTKFTRKAKVQLGVAALLIVASFWGLFSAYFAIYNNTGSGNQAETLTGRTVLWTVALSMSMERPWFGHGIYSFKSLIPALGPFAAVHAHNELLQQFFDYGLAGVVIVFALYSSLMRQAWRASANELRTLTLALLIFALLRGLADTVPIGLSYPLWLMAALSICLTLPQQTEGNAR
jgi:exopolysaccharide production protein ExoQ